MALNNDNVVNLIEGIVDTLRPVGTIISQSFDAATMILTLELSDIFDLDVDKYIEIDGQQYKIKSLNGLEITVASTGLIPSTSYKIPYPYFFHGTYQMVNETISAINDQQQKLPAVFLFYNISQKEILDRTSAFSRIPKFQLAFLDHSTTDFTPDEHQNVMDIQYNQWLMFYEQLRINNFVGEIDEADVTFMANFGQFFSSKGELTHLIAEQMTGVLVQIDVPIYKHFESCKIEHFEFFKCAPNLIVDPNGVLKEKLTSGQTYIEPVEMLFNVEPGNDTTIEITDLPIGLAYTFENQSLDNVTSVTYEIDDGNGYLPAVLPFDIEVGYSIKVVISPTNLTNRSTVLVST